MDGIPASKDAPVSSLALTDFHLIFDNLMGVIWYASFLIDIFLINSETKYLFMFIKYFTCFLLYVLTAHSSHALSYYFVLFY